MACRLLVPFFAPVSKPEKKLVRYMVSYTGWDSSPVWVGFPNFKVEVVVLQRLCAWKKGRSSVRQCMSLTATALTKLKKHFTGPVASGAPQPAQRHSHPQTPSQAGLPPPHQQQQHLHQQHL